MKVVAIAPQTLLWVAGGVAAFWVLGHLADFLVMVFLAIIVAAAVRPAVSWGDRHVPWFPRQLTPLAVFVLLFALLALIALLLTPVVATQYLEFAASLPKIGARFEDWWASATGFLSRFGIHFQASQIGAFFTGKGAAWVRSTAAIASALATGVSMAVFVFIGSFFILLDESRLANGLVRLTPPTWRPWVEAQFEPIAARLGGYVRGLLLNVSSLATMLAVGYTLGHVPFGVVLGIIGGLLAVIPFGELVGFIIALLVAFASAPTFWSIARVGICFGIAEILQQNIIGPLVMSRAIALPPVILIFALLLGSRLLGIEGLVVAVPLAATIAVLVENLWIPILEGSVRPGEPGPEPPPPSPPSPPAPPP